MNHDGISVPWLEYYARHIFHMSQEDFLEKTPGEIYGLVGCHLVMNGMADEVPKKKKYTYEEALEALRT